MATKRRKRIFILGLLIILGILTWPFGKYSYLTAVVDILRNKPTLVIYGEQDIKDQAMDVTAAQYGFDYKFEGCTIGLFEGADNCNSLMNGYLTMKLGNT